MIMKCVSTVTMLILATVWIAIVEAQQISPILIPQNSNSTASLRGLSVVDSKVAWASGSGGTVLRTIDGGETWTTCSVPDAEALDFRDIQAFGPTDAVVISAGTPAHVYLTSDGGANWQLAYENDDQRIFFDAMAFWDRQRGIAFSDPIEGRLVIITTADGGKSWQEADEESRPQALAGEAGFAASGTCLAVAPDGKVWIGLGGSHSGGTARVVYSDDFGAIWHASETPIVANPSGGIFSLAMSDDNVGVAVGGNYQAPDETISNCAMTADSGRTWKRPTGQPPRGYRSCVAVAHRGQHRLLVATGTSGTDYSADDGQTWTALDDRPLHTVAFSFDSSAGWATGPEGMIVTLDCDRLFGKETSERR